MPLAPNKAPILNSETQAVVSPRNIRKRKLDHPEAAAALREWLFTDKKTYAQARELLSEKFGISIGLAGLCEFWQRESRKQEISSHVAHPSPAYTIRIDLVIHSDGPIQIESARAKVESKTSGQNKEGGKA